MSNTSTDTETAKPEAKVAAPTKEELRNQIFSKQYTTTKKIPIPFNGVDLEFRQPSVEQMLNMQEEDDGKNYIVKAIIANTFIPNTDEHIFDIADYDMLVKMPMNGSWQKAVQAIMDVLDVKIEEKVKN